MKVCRACGEAIAEPGARYCPACGEPLAEEPAAEIFDGRYAVESELGRGAMGVVHLARDIHLDRPVALKVVAPAFAKNSVVVAHLQREAAALAKVRSDHVVQVYAFGPHLDSYFFAMEFVHGQNLADVIEAHANHGALVPIERALTILRQIATGLDAVHAAGLIHRDVKPGNVVIEERTGRAVLVDFGLVLPADHRASQVMTGGSPAYMPPEQAAGRALTAQADVYAFACTAFELLTGSLPFDGESVLTLLGQHAEAPRPLPSSVSPERAPFDAALARAMSKSPADRHPTCGALAAELSACAAVDHSGVPSGPRSQNRNSDAATAATVVAVAPPSQPDVRLVLVVDDDPAFVRFAERAAGFAFAGVPARVASASTGAEALARARAAMPHLVLMDYDMPGLDGVQTLARLRDLPRGGDARVLVASATAGQAEAWRFSVLGVQDFVRKPIQLPALVAAIEQLGRRAGWTTGSELLTASRRRSRP